MLTRLVFLPLLLTAGITARGCEPGRGMPAPLAEPAPGIAVRRLEAHGTRLYVIDADLRRSEVRLEVAADDIALREGMITGAARTVPEWLRLRGAVAGVNGGFFGRSLRSGHKEIVGLLQVRGRVRVAAPNYRARPSGVKYARAALGSTPGGLLRMDWVTSRPGAPQDLRAHGAPLPGGNGRAWDTRQALACGPRLVENGRLRVTQREERLASPGRLPRTLVAYGGGRLVLVTADALEFRDGAAFLLEYFRRTGGRCEQGMALDGGSSTQAAWRQGNSVQADGAAVVTVPTALLLHASRP